MRFNTLYFVLNTRENISPFVSFETLERIISIFTDFCGILSETTIKQNLLLIYEIVDEMIVCNLKFIHSFIIQTFFFCLLSSFLSQKLISKKMTSYLFPSYSYFHFRLSYLFRILAMYKKVQLNL